MFDFPAPAVENQIFQPTGGPQYIYKHPTWRVHSTVSGDSDPSYNVRDFGALGDGVTDDTAALNAFFAAIRAAQTTAITPEETTIRGVIPPGVYICGNVNATGISSFNWVLDCQGAILKGVVAGKPVLDMMDTRWFTIKDLTIWGDETNRPTIGIQQGRVVAANSYGECTFSNIRMDGFFSKACFYNFACEVNLYEHPTWYNRDTSATSYVIVMDGRNDFGVTSDFATQTIVAGTQVSFLGQLFLNADFRKLFGGPCYLAIGNFGGHDFTGSYMVSVNDYPIVTSKSTEIRHWRLDVHVETTGAIGWLLVDNVNPSGNVVFMDLLIKDYTPANTGSFINLTGTTRTVVIDGLKMSIGNTSTNPPIVGGGHGGDANKLVVNGEIIWASSRPLVLSGMTFNGGIVTRDVGLTTITHTVGAYSITRRPTTTTDRIKEFKGPVRSSGRSIDTLPANYIEMVGNAAGGGATLQTGGADADVHLLLLPKGANGHVWMGAHTASGDAAVNGYITIRDAGGTLRKLAVIA